MATITKRNFFFVINMLLFLLFSFSASIEAQKYKLRDLTKTDKKVFFVVENPDSVEMFYETALKYLKKLGRWKIVQSMSDADFVLLIKGFNIEISGYAHFECYPQIFDNKMNFIYRGDFVYKSGTIWDNYDLFFDKTLKSVINRLPLQLMDGKISNVSIYYLGKLDEKNKEMSSTSRKYYEKNYKLALEAMEYSQINKAVDYLTKCIMNNPLRHDLYKQRALLYLEIDKGGKALSDLKRYAKYEPLDPDIDIFWQIARYEKSESDVKKIKRSLAAIAVLNAINQGLTQFNSSFTTSSFTNDYSAGSSGTTTSTNREKCIYCNETGISPVAKSVVSFASGGEHWCKDCKKMVSDSHGYHDKCPSCGGKGYIIRVK